YVKFMYYRYANLQCIYSFPTRRSSDLNYKEDEIFLLDNGDAVNLSKGKEPFVSKNEIKTSEILIDGTAVGDVNDFVMRDRELLRSEEHTSELQSRENLVCRLLLEKKKK